MYLILLLQVLTDEDWNELTDYDEEATADAKQRLKDLKANKEKVKISAKYFIKCDKSFQFDKERVYIRETPYPRVYSL